MAYISISERSPLRVRLWIPDSINWVVPIVGWRASVAKTRMPGEGEGGRRERRKGEKGESLLALSISLLKERDGTGCSLATGRCSKDARSRSSSSSSSAEQHGIRVIWRVCIAGLGRLGGGGREQGGGRCCARGESRGAAGTREASWWGLTRSRSATVLRSRGDVISEGSAWICSLSLFLSHAPSSPTLSPSSSTYTYPPRFVHGLAFGPSRKARTRERSPFFSFRLSLSSFSLLFFSRMCVRLDSSIRRLTWKKHLYFFISRELSSPTLSMRGHARNSISQL